MDKLKELKATAYDILANIEFLQSKLREVNAQIAQLSKDEENGSANDTSNS